MKLFPTDKYTIELNESLARNIDALRRQTKPSVTLSSQKTDRQFIGRIGENGFEIINSTVGIGAFAVFKGKFQEKSITVVTEVNKPFKILVTILAVLGTASIGIAIFSSSRIGLLIPLVLWLLFIRFAMIGMFFKISSNLTLDRLRRTLV